MSSRILRHNMGSVRLYLRRTGGLRRRLSSRGRRLQDGGGPRLLERFSPLDSSTRTLQPHIVLKHNAVSGGAGRRGSHPLRLRVDRRTFHLVLWPHRWHLWDPQTPQKQSLGGSWPPTRCGGVRSSRRTAPAPSCSHCSQGFQHTLYNQEGSLEEMGLRRQR